MGLFQKSVQVLLGGGMKRKDGSHFENIDSKSRDMDDFRIDRIQSDMLVINDHKHAETSQLRQDDNAGNIGHTVDLGSSNGTVKTGSGIAQQHRRLKDDVAQSERSRIAAILHDGVAQSLQAIYLGLKSLGVLVADRHPQSNQMLGQLIAEVGEAIDEVRAVCHELRPRILEYMALHEAVCFQCSELAKRSGIPIQCQSKLAPYALKDHVKLQCFLCFREALGNALKHADASRIEVTMTLTKPGFLSVCIVDDGKGFDPGLIIDRSVGLGLAMITERVESVGGYARIQSALAEGTQVRIMVPLTTQENLQCP
jgi:signal transduction histidine kinase